MPQITVCHEHRITSMSDCSKFDFLFETLPDEITFSKTLVIPSTRNTHRKRLTRGYFIARDCSDEPLYRLYYRLYYVRMDWKGLCSQLVVLLRLKKRNGPTGPCLVLLDLLANSKFTVRVLTLKRLLYRLRQLASVPILAIKRWRLGLSYSH